MLVLVDFVQMVVDALPHFAVIVCVKLLDALVTVSVCLVPSVPFTTFNEDFLGIVGNEALNEAPIVPLAVPVTNDAEQLKVFVPLAL
jgi:hypothetical protein